MAFPSSGGTHQDDLLFLWRQARVVTRQIKDQASSLRATSAVGSLQANSILGFSAFLYSMRVQLQAAASAVGMNAFAQNQIGDATINIATEFTAMLTQIDSVIAWIIANFPKDGNGFLLAQTFNADNSGRTVDRPFTTIQMAGFRAVLDGLVASID